MQIKKPNRLLILFFFCLCNLSFQVFAQPKYEFRAAWVASVVNIDWPSKKGLPVEDQKASFIQLLDFLKGLGMNAVIVQIRPAADAFYPSPYEPWSEFLNGKQGVPPNPYYDPLAFMIEETHKRGMEFHAWLNPYRAVFNLNTSDISSNHITKQHPEWFINYGTTKFFNPGLPEVVQYVSGIVRDIVKRYDIDAIHMDDYFYPYRIAGKEFADNAAYLKYGKPQGLSKDDWRRSNCDSIILRIHQVILQEKPLIKFGISPFGVWRNKSKDPNGSDTKAGQTNYDDLYADILLWLKEGWIDYVAPQLYWEINHKLCDYTTLLDWWANHTYGKDLYIGHGLYRATENPSPAWRRKAELPEEIQLLRNNKNVQGSIYFSAKDFFPNPNGWCDSLRNHYYKYPALIPPMNWIDTIAPMQPSILKITDNQKTESPSLDIYCNAAHKLETEEVKNIVLYFSNSISGLGKLPIQIQAVDTHAQTTINLPISSIPDYFNDCFLAITSVDRQNNESPLSKVMHLVKTKSGWKINKL
ncbi:MAG: family 10 glycosylhydrolase [Bacteroidetes bacterium]|nr:family 10 glycosylhydrolase [Bacteroidota bacterium]